MQAAVGIAQLKKLDEIIKKNRFNKSYLKSKIKKISILNTELLMIQKNYRTLSF